MEIAENCVNVRIDHIDFREDCIVFTFAKSKGHQKGEEYFGPWHVYANPHKPWMFPLLSMARYNCCYPELLKGGVPLFDGSRQYTR